MECGKKGLGESLKKYIILDESLNDLRETVKRSYEVPSPPSIIALTLPQGAGDMADTFLFGFYVGYGEMTTSILMILPQGVRRWPSTFLLFFLKRAVRWSPAQRR